MNILLEARSILNSAGYRTLGTDSDATLFFEDDSVLGMVRRYPDAASLIAEWEPAQDRFLREYAGKFRANPDKAWNIYTVHLSTEAASPAQISDLFQIEEDYAGVGHARRSVGK